MRQFHLRELPAKMRCGSLWRCAFMAIQLDHSLLGMVGVRKTRGDLEKKTHPLIQHMEDPCSQDDP